MTEWTQTPSHITLTFYIPQKINKNSLDILISETFIKINIYELKLIKIVDLLNEIDIEDNQTIIEDSKIVLFLKKLNQETWSALGFKGEKSVLKERRHLSEEKYKQFLLKKNDLAQNKKKEFEKFTLDKSIKIDEDRRKELNNKKQEEKLEAENSLFDYIKQSKEEEVRSKENLNINLNNNLEIKKEHLNLTNQNNEIFNKDDLKAQIRQESNIKINLTEKLIPHFAARESMSKEPPHPKSKKYEVEKNIVKYFII